VCGTVVRLLCDTYVVFLQLYSPTAMVVLVAHIGRNHMMAIEVDLQLCLLRTRQGGSMYMLYVIC